MDRDVAGELFARRVQYETAGLDVADVAADPIEQWRRWYDDAASAGVTEPNAMVSPPPPPTAGPTPASCSSAASTSGASSSTPTTTARRARQVSDNPRGAGVFAWLDLHRQVRVRGPMERGQRRGERRLLRLATAGQPGRRVGLAAERGPRRPCRPRSSDRRHRAASSTGRDVDASRVLGRLAPRDRRDRVLAGPAEPPPRPCALPPRRRRSAGSSSASPRDVPTSHAVKRMRATWPVGRVRQGGDAARPRRDRRGWRCRRRSHAGSGGVAGGGSAHARRTSGLGEHEDLDIGVEDERARRGRARWCTGSSATTRRRAPPRTPRRRSCRARDR